MNEHLESINNVQNTLQSLKESKIKAMVRLQKLDMAIDKIEKYTDYFINGKIDAEILISVLENEISKFSSK